MNAKTAAEVFDGLMLGDAGLYHTGVYAQFSLSLSAKQNREMCNSMLRYLAYVRDTLSLLGMGFCSEHPKVYNGFSRGKYYLRPTLKSLVHPFLQEQYVRWYAHGDKGVPENVIITPTSLAHWFTCDGCSSQDKRCITVNTSLQTHRFNEADLSILESKLLYLGLHTGRSNYNSVRSGSGIAITILQGSVNDFMHMIDPFVVEPYRYKIKYRNGHSEGNVSQLAQGVV